MACRSTRRSIPSARCACLSRSRLPPRRVAPVPPHPPARRTALARRLFLAGMDRPGRLTRPAPRSWTSDSFAAHMAQHEIMMLVASPLMVLARPYGVILWGLPQPLANVLARLMQARGTRRVGSSLCSPIVAWLLHAAVLWSWHVPPAFEAALAHASVHWIQHITFFLSAVIFWWSVFAPGPLAERRGAAIVSVFTTAVHTS
ncbi:MAG: cytochrome c oxidase assembly protein, partial [Burkholderiales bacterium]